MVAYETNGERRNRHPVRRGSVETDPGYSAKALETNGVNSDVGAVRAALTAAQTGLVDREAIAEAVVLCAIAREHLLVIGPPGTGKSEAVRRVAEVLGGSYFEYLIGRFTEPNELFGPIDLRRLREGVVEVETAAGPRCRSGCGWPATRRSGARTPRCDHAGAGRRAARSQRRGRRPRGPRRPAGHAAARRPAGSGGGAARRGDRAPRAHADVACVWAPDGRVVAVDLATRAAVANLTVRVSA
jgi:hypothetical protein